MNYRNKSIMINYRVYGPERGYRVHINGKIIFQDNKVWLGKTKNAAECKALCAIDRSMRDE